LFPPWVKRRRLYEEDTCVRGLVGYAIEPGQPGYLWTGRVNQQCKHSEGMIRLKTQKLILNSAEIQKRTDSWPITHLKFIIYWGSLCSNPYFPKQVSQNSTREKGSVLIKYFGTDIFGPLWRFTSHISIFKAEKSFGKETNIIAINQAFPKFFWLLNPLAISCLSCRECYSKNEYYGWPGGPFSILSHCTPVPALVCQQHPQPCFFQRWLPQEKNDS